MEQEKQELFKQSRIKWLGQAQGSLKAEVFKVSLLERPFLFSKFLVI